jgi:DNA-binding response OmpR family regulator
MMLAYEPNPLDHELLKVLLMHEGYQADVVATEEALLARCRQTPEAMVVLGMHELERGLSLVQRVRQLTGAPLAVIGPALGDEPITQLYELGADEVLTRPLCPQRLAARLRNMRRRSAAPATGDAGEENVSVGSLRLYPTLMRLHKGDKVIHLTPLQTRLLYTLMLNAGQIVSKPRLEDKIWGYQGESCGNPLKTHIFHLRQKVEEDPQSPELIRTVKGIGYVFHAQVPALAMA